MSELTVSWQQWVRALRDDLAQDAASGAGIGPAAQEAANLLTHAVTLPMATAAGWVESAWEILPAGTLARARAGQIVRKMRGED